MRRHRRAGRRGGLEATETIYESNTAEKNAGMNASIYMTTAEHVDVIERATGPRGDTAHEVNMKHRDNGSVYIARLVAAVTALAVAVRILDAVRVLRITKVGCLVGS